MPYIEEELREEIETELDALIKRLRLHDDVSSSVHTKQITYAIFKILVDGYGDDGLRWYYRMDALKVLDACRAEFVRRFINAKEQEALEKNGDV